MSAAGDRARFPRTVRLLRHRDFERVYKQGKRHFAPHLTVFYFGHSGRERPKVGFTVGKVLGKAVERNRLRRRLREAVRLHLQELNTAVDVVIHPKKSAVEAAFAELQNEIARSFEVITKASRKVEAKK
ncbi:MAG TPA: ribonuclease P protein component [Terriglobales bacterium]|nr:ribonuclease P protein component [Terriglobales bacterium]